MTATATGILARENRIMIDAIKNDISEIKINMFNISNHYSKRIPMWASILFMILTAVLGALIGVKL